MGQIYLEGMLLQASLIFALGPQNLFILESGLMKRHHLLVSFICFLCDLTLIMLGVVGAATLFNQYPQVKIFVGVVGIGFLLLYGLNKIRFRNHSFSLKPGNEKNGLRLAIMSSISFSVINPHAYLDGVVLIGGYSSKFPDLTNRMALGLGAASFSLLWFLMLSVGASALMPIFQNARRLRVMMCCAGLMLLFLSARLSLDVYSWVLELYPETMATFNHAWN